MTSQRPVELLHVDDDPAFAELAAEYLERADDRFVVTGVSDVESGLTRLREESYDCVVSDYEMPDRDGIEFLEAVRAEWPDLPFLLFTGRGSEAVAEEAIAAGVTDYIRKHGGTQQYEILANRIDNAVRARRSATQARQRRERLESILTTVPSCVVQLDPEGRFVYANDRAETVLGLSPDEVTERRYDDPEWGIRDPDGTPIASGNLPFERVREAGEPIYGFRHTIQSPDGKRRTLSMNGAPTFENGELASVVFSLTDITDRLWRERALSALHDVAVDLAACESRRAVAERTVAASDELLSFDVSVVSFAENGRLSVVAASDDGDWASMSVEEGAAGRAYRTGESEIVADVRADPEAVERESYRSVLTVPAGEHGVFQAAVARVDAFDEEDLELAETLVAHAETALRRVDGEARIER